MAGPDLSGSLPARSGEASQISGDLAPTLKAPAGASSPDTISSAGGASSSSTIQSDSPVLLEALYDMWFIPMGNQIINTSNPTGVGEIDSIASSSASKSYEARMREICLSVLEQWSKNVNEEVKKARKEMEKDELAAEIRNSYERHVRLGIGAITAVENYSRTAAASSDPAVATGLASVAAALVIGGGLRYDYVVPDAASSGTLVAIKPIQDANNMLLMQMAPNQSAELGYLGAIIATAAAFTSIAQTIPVVKADQEGASTDLQFAREYASNIVKTFDSKELDEFCMTLISHSVKEGDSLTSEQVSLLVKYVKLTLMATSLALLYKMESSFKGQGGGVTGQEFLSLLNGDIEAVSPLDLQLAEGIRTLLAEIPQDEAAGFLASLASWIDSTKQSNSRLVNVQSLIDGMVAARNPSDLEA